MVAVCWLLNVPATGCVLGVTSVCQEICIRRRTFRGPLLQSACKQTCDRVRANEGVCQKAHDEVALGLFVGWLLNVPATG